MMFRPTKPHLSHAVLLLALAWPACPAAAQNLQLTHPLYDVESPVPGLRDIPPPSDVRSRYSSGPADIVSGLTSPGGPGEAPVGVDSEFGVPGTGVGFGSGDEMGAAGVGSDSGAMGSSTVGSSTTASSGMGSGATMGSGAMGSGGMGSGATGSGGMSYGGMGSDQGPPGAGAPGMGAPGMPSTGPGGSGGAGPFASNEGLSAQTVSVQGEQRPFYLHVPADLSSPAPVVFVFHGGGGRPQAIAARSGWNEEADRHGFLVVYPEGPPAPSGRGDTWNIGGDLSPVSTDDTGYVAAILKDIRQDIRVSPTQIYATGMSMGGVFSYRLACEMSDTFAAIAPVSATMVEPNCKPTSPVAVFHIHGSDDERIPLDGGPGAMSARAWPAPTAAIAAWSRIDGCEGKPSRTSAGDVTCETYDHCRAAVEMCILAGGTHAWPEGAARQIWAFFAAHPKSST